MADEREMSTQPSRQTTPLVRSVAIATLFVFIVLGAPSIWKYIDYETSNGVSRLRANTGKRVEIPQQTFHVLGETTTHRPSTGVLRYVGYRFNDVSGFFDCELHLDAERGGDMSVHTGLSPEEVRQVKVIDGP